MGLEMICKGYLLAVHRAEYKDLVEKKANETINLLAKKWGHEVKKLIRNIKSHIGKEKIQPFLEKEFRGFGQKKDPCRKNKKPSKTVLSAIEAAYLECRYPVPHSFCNDNLFKVNGFEDAYFDPLYSSDIPKFCYELCKVIFTDLKENFGICIPKSWFNQKITGDKGRRFGNLLFESREKYFLSTNSNRRSM